MKSKTDCTITLNYPTSESNRPRWGYDQPPHPQLCALIDRRRAQYAALLDECLRYKESYRQIALCAAGGSEPSLTTPWLPGLDSFLLYSLVARHRPATYLEVGSGSSTQFARRSIRDHGLSTQIFSVDPAPRAEIDALCDRVWRKPVEAVDLSIFEALRAGDILFVDNSHRSFMNSDVTVFFLDILPRLAPGVLVQIHDIFLPYDYPPHWAERFYNEQYLLAAYLLAGGERMAVIAPNAWISRDSSLHARALPVFDGLPGVSSGGGSFWFEVQSDLRAEPIRAQ